MEDLQNDSERFKAIFDLCDEDKDGYIDVIHFTELAKDHFGAEGLDLEEITGVINLLDPEGRGLISLDDFCRGVGQIVEIQQQAHSSRIKSSVSIDTLVPLDIAGDLTSLHSLQETVSTPTSQATFAEYDFDGLTDLSGSSNNGTNNDTPTNPSYNTTASTFLDDLTGFGQNISSFGESTSASNNPFLADSFLVPQFNSTVLAPPGGSEDEADSALSGRSSEINESSRPEITDEENYEDFGEVESEADISDHGLTNRRLTTAALASQLQKSSREVTPNGTRRSSYGSDEIFDDIDGNFQDLNDRVKDLESQLRLLTNSQGETSTKQNKLKDENSVLVTKVLYLEEQLRDMELKADDRLGEERKLHQDLIVRHNREKTEQVDYLTQRLQRIEGEYETLKEEASKMRLEINKLRSEKIELQERMLEKQEMYNMLYDDNERLKAEYHRQEDLHKQERRSTGQLLDELGKELDELRKYKIEVESGARTPSGSVSYFPRQYQDLQSEIHKLKEENRGLQNSNEDLNAQLMNRCVEEGKSLLMDVASSKSLAEELEHLTKEELMEKLRQEQEFGMRLKQYVDRIIITILEKNPSLLEIGRQA